VVALTALLGLVSADVKKIGLIPGVKLRTLSASGSVGSLGTNVSLTKISAFNPPNKKGAVGGRKARWRAGGGLEGLGDMLCGSLEGGEPPII